MIFSFPFLFLGALFAGQTSGPAGMPDPEFQKVPFDQWLGEREPKREPKYDQRQLRWTVSVTRPLLTFHQRLMARVEFGLDGRELDARRGDGRLIFFVQILDHDGARFQTHGGTDLSKLSPSVAASNFTYIQSAFFLPGDYRLAVAVLDTRTGEHSVRQEQFRVAGPRDFLEAAWRGLPSVEFFGNEESPDSWYLPAIHGRLQWAASVQSPARLHVVLNLAPTVPATHRTQSGDLAALIPTLKAISQTGSASVSEQVELIDLARRRAVFQQDAVHDLDWPRLKDSLSDANSAAIDVHSLSERSRDAQFFVSQARKLIHGSKSPCVLVVLTAPVAFESGEDLQPISLEDLPACRVVYIRYRAPVQLGPSYGRGPGGFGGRGRGRGMGGPASRTDFGQNVADQLAATLKPLSPKIFEVETPDQMTKALAEVEKDLLAAGAQ